MRKLKSNSNKPVAIRKVGRAELYSLRKVAELAGISWQTAVKYAKRSQVNQYRRRPEGYHWDMFTIGTVVLFRKMFKERPNGRPRIKRRGIKPKKRNYKWYAGKKIPDWAEPNTKKQHKLDKEINLNEFHFK